MLPWRSAASAALNATYKPSFCTGDPPLLLPAQLRHSWRLSSRGLVLTQTSMMSAKPLLLSFIALNSSTPTTEIARGGCQTLKSSWAKAPLVVFITERLFSVLVQRRGADSSSGIGGQWTTILR